MADLQSDLKHLNAAIECSMQSLNVPGLAIGITNCERLLFVGHYGWANRDSQQPVTSNTLFQIGSISKAFTSILLLQLQEQGLLNIDDPITKYLPWFEVQSEYDPITLRHLMSHTAGIIKGSDETPAAQTEAWNLRHTWATTPPGERFHYSNSGYKVLGLVLQTLLGQPIAEILRQRLLDPLGMNATEPVFTHATRTRLAVGYESYYDDRPHPRGGPLAPATWLEADSADGSICSTAEDMCCYLRALLQRGADLITPDSFEQLIQPIIPTCDGLHGEHYGLGMCTTQVDGHHIISHSGGMVGYQSHLLADLDAGLGIIALNNSLNSPEDLANLAWVHLVAYLDGKEIPEVPPANPYAVKNIDDYVARFRCGEKEFLIFSQGELLYLEFKGDSVLLEPTAPDVFLVPHPAFELFLLYFKREQPPAFPPPPGDGEELKDNKGTGVEESFITSAFHGPDVYLREGCSIAPAPSYPPGWDAYPGHYRTFSPWYPNIRVVLRKGTLILIEPNGEEHALHPLEPGRFRMDDDPRSPEFMAFDLLIDGKAQQAILSGGIYCRIFTP